MTSYNYTNINVPDEVLQNYLRNALSELQDWTNYRAEAEKSLARGIRQVEYYTNEVSEISKAIEAREKQND